jgi:hypothetical protein
MFKLRFADVDRKDDRLDWRPAHIPLKVYQIVQNARCWVDRAVQCPSLYKAVDILLRNLHLYLDRSVIHVFWSVVCIPACTGWLQFLAGVKVSSVVVASQRR